MAMNMDKQSRILYFSTIAVLGLGLAVAVLGPMMGPAPVALTAEVAASPARMEGASAEDPLLAFQRERSMLRSEERRTLREIMDDPSADSMLVAQAGTRLMKVMDWTDQEATIEGILRARGYEGLIVSVHQDSANVLIRGDAPTRQQAAQILELVSRETGLGGGEIKIIPVE